MSFSANCPTCGAPVVFKSSASFHGVCEFCRSTLVRHGGDLENLGRMADLVEDASPIRLGTEGRYQGVHFAVVGRIQLRYAAGVWNEWHLLFDNQRSGWLSDANGEYLLSFLTPPGAALPEFATLMPNDEIMLAGSEFVVTDIEEAMCLSGEGELPFAFGAGYPAPLVDLRGTDESKAAFASIDYSESPPLVFIGQSLPFATFNFANLRDGAAESQAAGEVRALACPACGGAITLHDKAVQSVACPSCLSVLDAGNESLGILARAAAATRIEPLVALGSRGHFAGKEWTVIGFQQRVITALGIEYPWQEYMLHHPSEGFRWLVESSGHWSWVSPVANPPRYRVGEPGASYGGIEYRRFSAGTAVTRYVIGEFTWKIKLGETWETLDFTAPPKSLSRESNRNETSWSVGEYLPPDEVAAAFALKAKLPEPVGIGMAQPNPRRESTRRVFNNFLLFLVLAVFAQIAWLFIFGGSTLLDQRMVFTAQNQESLSTQEFQLESGARNIVLRHDTNLDNNWLGLGLTLVEKVSGRAWAAQSEIAYWHGVDGGESWSEGDRSHELVFRDLPAGRYYFVIDPEISAEKPVAVVDRIQVTRDQATWSNFFFLLAFLAAIPLFNRYRVNAFEQERWKEADYLSSGEEFGSDDDDGDDD